MFFRLLFDTSGYFFASIFHLREGHPVQFCDLENDIGVNQNLINTEPKVVARRVRQVKVLQKGIAENNRRFRLYSGFEQSSFRSTSTA